jgi:probable F420-dependent oxidoreductase
MENAVDIGLARRLSFGITVNLTDGAQASEIVNRARSLGYESIWAGDHIAAHVPINDPLIQLAYLAALAPELRYGTSVYLLPLRPPAVVAKLVATIDRLLGAGRFIFGVGVGGEFGAEYKACGVDVHERGGRMDEALQVLGRLWNDESPVEHHGKYFDFPSIDLKPKPLSPGGPPIWLGGRAEAALRRAAEVGHGWIPYVITPQRYAQGLERIAQLASTSGRQLENFGTGLFLFFNVGESFEQSLEVAAGMIGGYYAMDFRAAARRYCALGRPSDVAAKIAEFRDAGARDFVLAATAPAGEHAVQLERFAREVIPLVQSA